MDYLVFISYGCKWIQWLHESEKSQRPKSCVSVVKGLQTNEQHEIFKSLIFNSLCYFQAWWNYYEIIFTPCSSLELERILSKLSPYRSGRRFESGPRPFAASPLSLSLSLSNKAEKFKSSKAVEPMHSQQAYPPKKVGIDHQHVVRFKLFLCFFYRMKNSNCQKHELITVFCLYYINAAQLALAINSLKWCSIMISRTNAVGEIYNGWLRNH